MPRPCYPSDLSDEEWVNNSATRCRFNIALKSGQVSSLYLDSWATLFEEPDDLGARLNLQKGLRSSSGSY